MDLRGLAQLGCRLLAAYCGVEALASLPLVVAPLLAGDETLATLLRTGALPRIALLAAATLVLLFAARPIADRLCAGLPATPAGALRRPIGGDVIRALVIATGILVLAGAIESIAALAVSIHAAGFAQAWRVPAVIAGGVTVVLRVGAGVVLVALAKPVTDLLRDVSRPAVAEDASMGELIRDLVSAGGTLGVRRLADLATVLRVEAEGVAKRVMRSSIDAVMSAVENSRPDFGAMSEDGTVTIVFSDMEGFSSMTQRLGDERAHEVIKSHNRIVRTCVKAHRGQEVELQGDGFLLAFPQAVNAVRCALAIQEGCAGYSEEHPDEPIRVRIGLHTGKPIKDRERFFGITVILAARIASQARGGETLVSSQVHEILGAEGEFRFDGGREAQLKGLEGTHRMFAVTGA